jgi:hypothetical protein
VATWNRFSAHNRRFVPFRLKNVPQNRTESDETTIGRDVTRPKNRRAIIEGTSHAKSETIDENRARDAVDRVDARLTGAARHPFAPVKSRIFLILQFLGDVICLLELILCVWGLYNPICR